MLSILRGALPVKEPLLLRFRQEGLRPHGYDGGIGGITRVKKYHRYISTGVHFVGGDTPGHGDVLQPQGQAAGALDCRGVGAAVESLQDSFFIMVY